MARRAATLSPKTPLISVEQWSEHASSPWEGGTLSYPNSRPSQTGSNSPTKSSPCSPKKCVFYHQSTTKMEPEQETSGSPAAATARSYHQRTPRAVSRFAAAARRSASTLTPSSTGTMRFYSMRRTGCGEMRKRPRIGPNRPSGERPAARLSISEWDAQVPQ
jgi:hypothetical protein